jgi:SlyX protein
MADSGDFEEIRELLVELQTQVAFQENLLSDLNNALAQQQRDLADLKRQGELLRDQYRELQQQLPGREVIEKPPHY